MHGHHLWCLRLLHMGWYDAWDYCTWATSMISPNISHGHHQWSPVFCRYDASDYCDYCMWAGSMNAFDYCTWATSMMSPNIPHGHHMWVSDYCRYDASDYCTWSPPMTSPIITHGCKYAGSDYCAWSYLWMLRLLYDSTSDYCTWSPPWCLRLLYMHGLHVWCLRFLHMVTTSHPFVCCSLWNPEDEVPVPVLVPDLVPLKKRGSSVSIPIPLKTSRSGGAILVLIPIQV